MDGKKNNLKYVTSDRMVYNSEFVKYCKINLCIYCVLCNSHSRVGTLHSNQILIYMQ